MFFAVEMLSEQIRPLEIVAMPSASQVAAGVPRLKFRPRDVGVGDASRSVRGALRQLQRQSACVADDPCLDRGIV